MVKQQFGTICEKTLGSQRMFNTQIFRECSESRTNALHRHASASDGSKNEPLGKPNEGDRRLTPTGLKGRHNSRRGRHAGIRAELLTTAHPRRERRRWHTKYAGGLSD